MSDWFKYIDGQLIGQLSEWRRTLHQFPEISNQEWETVKRLKAWLRDMEIDIMEFEGMPGFVALIPGLTDEEIAFRADIDALPIEEGKDCSYASKELGVMHACGHDGHMAILLGLAKVLKEMQLQGKLKRSVRLIFQHSEEQVPGGAIPMIEAGALGNVKRIFGLHLWSSLEIGKIGIRPGVMMAAADRFIINIQGKGGHGSMPHQTVDTIIVASQVIQSLQTIVSRNINPLDSAVLSIGTVHAGTNFNIIADKAKLTGTVRTFLPEVRAQIKQRIDEIVTLVCKTYNAEHTLIYIEGYPPVNNHESLTEEVTAELSKVIDTQNIIQIPPVMGGEDFSYYQKRIPGVFFFVGAGNHAKQFNYPQHHPKYDIDEDSLAVGVKCFLAIYEKYNNTQEIG
ncbi:hypothetical protein BHF68_00485 [Desulfuribacillus alkaliarsenatis]|uniref:Peptidase M20 dimerisation domain-containing protein n=1 Tax=Desulfuribacillus alkaliarsenatis TaxID=766136 RepID=A0A1E5G6F8_9FIRM|nr:hypothetical protein BHF68_00485 [Desulfuribacillus alkaliarsenatis]